MVIKCQPISHKKRIYKEKNKTKNIKQYHLFDEQRTYHLFDEQR